MPFFACALVARRVACFVAGLLVLVLGLGRGTARAQGPAVAPLLYADQMPALASGGGNAAVVAAIQKNLKYPKPASAKATEGRVVVSITIEADGRIGDTKVVKSPRPDCAAAVLAAVQRLPRFEPGRQDGHPVAVVITVPLTILVDVTAPVNATAETQP